MVLFDNKFEFRKRRFQKIELQKLFGYQPPHPLGKIVKSMCYHSCSVAVGQSSIYVALALAFYFELL